MKHGKATFPADKAYPQVDVSGYEEVEFNSLDQSGDPKQYQNTAEYTALPASVKVYDGLRHRRLIDLEGQLSDKLYVRYKIQEEPDMPDERDIYVEYDKFSIYFGKYDAQLKNGELFSVNKSIDGVHADYIDTDMQIEAIHGDERSHERTFSFNGNGKREYQLGQTNILEGSITVKLNGSDIAASDYVIDYADGTITFNKALSSTDRVEGSYEYMDPIEDFLPISSKVRLTGIQHRMNTYQKDKPIIATGNNAYTFVYTAQPRYVPVWDELPAGLAITNVSRNVYILTTANVDALCIYKGQQKIPAQRSSGWALNFPAAVATESITIEYQKDKYTIQRDAVLSYVNKTITQSRVIETVVTRSVVSGSVTSVVSMTVSRDEVVTKTAVVGALHSAPEYRVKTAHGVVTLPAQITVGESIPFMFQSTNPSLNEVTLQTDQGMRSLSRRETNYSGVLLVAEDALPGMHYVYVHCLLASGQTEMYRIPYVVVAPLEQAGLVDMIKLPHGNLISFAETITVDTKKLEPVKAYKLDYQSGVLRFTKPMSASANIAIAYTYQRVNESKLDIHGKDSQGPYSLGQVLIVPGSLELSLGDVPLIERTDYVLNAQEGTIMFNRKLREIDIVKAQLKYYEVVNRGAATQQRKSFAISSYFVQEKAKAAESVYGIDSKVTQADCTINVVNGITTITLPSSVRPIERGSTKVYINGVLTTNVKEINEFFGWIQVTGNLTSIPFAVECKTIDVIVQAPVYSFSGADRQGAQATVKLSLARPMIYKPMSGVKDGAPVVLQRKGRNELLYSTLEYRKSYIIGEAADLYIGQIDTDQRAKVRLNQRAWEQGIITFITGNSTSGYFVDTSVNDDDLYRLLYQLSDSDRPDPGDVSHQTYGTKINYFPTEMLQVDVEYNESNKQYQRGIASATQIAVGKGVDGQEIQLIVSGNTTLDVVEDSERVYVNDVLKTRNTHYTISYKGGLIRFMSGVVLNSKDTIRVEFNYYSNKASTQEYFQDKAKAVKIDSTVYLPRTQLTMTYVTVDAKYDPVGNAPSYYTAGTDARKMSVRTEPLDRLVLNAQVEKMDKKVGVYQNDQTVDRFQKEEVQHYDLAYGFNQQDSLSVIANRKDVTLPAEDINSGLHAVDTIAYDGEVKLGVGPETFRTATSVKNAEAFSDVLDREALSRTYSRSGQLNNTYRPWDNLNFVTNLSQLRDDEFSSIRRVQLSKHYGEMVRWTPWSIDTSLDLSADDYSTEKSLESDYYTYERTLGKDRSQVFNFSFRRPAEFTDPITQELFMHFDDTYKLKASDLYKQSPDMSRLDNLNLSVRPYDIASLEFDDAYNLNRAENNASRKYLKDNKYRIARFYPGKYFDWMNDDLMVVNKVELVRSTSEFRRSLQTSNTYNLDNIRQLNQSYSFVPADNLAVDTVFTYKNTETYNNSRDTSAYSEVNSISPQSTYGIDVEYTLEQWLGLYSIKALWTRDGSISKLHKRSFTSAVGLESTRDDLEKMTDQAEVQYRYWDRFTNRHLMKILDEFKQKTSEGSRQSLGQTNQLDARYDTPITGLGLTYTLVKVSDVQYKATNVELNRRSLVSRYDERLLRADDTNKIMADYTFIPELTFDAAIYSRVIAQQLIVNRNDPALRKSDTGQIKSRSYEFGVTYRPIPDFVSRYSWKKNFYDLGFGEERKLVADYKPLKLEVGELVYHFENIYNIGVGTNDPQQENSLNEVQGFVKTTVIDRDDIKVINTLVFKVNKDISNVIVDNMLIDVNLTRLHLWDRENPEYSYSLNAFYAKGTLNF